MGENVVGDKGGERHTRWQAGHFPVLQFYLQSKL